MYNNISSESVNRKNKAGYVIIIIVENKALLGGSTFFGMLSKEEHHLNRVLNEVRQTSRYLEKSNFKETKKGKGLEAGVCLTCQVPSSYLVSRTEQFLCSSGSSS